MSDSNSGSTPGKTVYTCMLNKKGGIEADLTVSALDEQGWDGISPLYPVSETCSLTLKLNAYKLTLVVTMEIVVSHLLSQANNFPIGRN